VPPFTTASAGPSPAGTDHATARSPTVMDVIVVSPAFVPLLPASSPVWSQHPDAPIRLSRSAKAIKLARRSHVGRGFATSRPITTGRRSNAVERGQLRASILQTKRSRSVMDLCVQRFTLRDA
jgi:hypothetical protein